MQRQPTAAIPRRWLALLVTAVLVAHLLVLRGTTLASLVSRNTGVRVGAGHFTACASGIMAADSLNGEAQPGDHGIKPMAAPAAPELAGEGHRIHKRHRAHRQPVPETALPEKRHIKPLAIVRDQGGIASKFRKSPQGLRSLRGTRDLMMGNPGQSSDEGGHPFDRAHKSLKPLALVPLPGPHLDAGDLDDVLGRGREAGGFEVENQIGHTNWRLAAAFTHGTA